MDNNGTVKKLRDALSKVAIDIKSSLSNQTLTKEEELRERKRVELLTEVNDSLQHLETNLDNKTTEGATRSRLVDFLNTLLETEYDAIFSYSYHALSVSDKELSRELLDFGVMEMRHFEMLRDKIVSFGVEPRWKLTKYMEYSEADPLKMLRQHLVDEERTIDICKEGIAEGLDNALEGFLEKTIEDEQWHSKRLKELIEKFAIGNSQ
jgi:rubrerythrin